MLNQSFLEIEKQKKTKIVEEKPKESKKVSKENVAPPQKKRTEKTTELSKNIVPQKRESDPVIKAVPKVGGILSGFSNLWKKSKQEVSDEPAATEADVPADVPKIPQQYLDKRRMELLFGSNP